MAKINDHYRVLTTTFAISRPRKRRKINDLHVASFCFLFQRMTGSTLSTMEKFDIDTVRSIVKTILVMYPDGVTRDELLGKLFYMYLLRYYFAVLMSGLYCGLVSV